MAASSSQEEEEQQQRIRLFDELWIAKFNLWTDHTIPNPAATPISPRSPVSDEALISLTLRSGTVTATQGYRQHPKTKVEMTFNFNLLDCHPEVAEARLIHILTPQIASIYTNDYYFYYYSSFNNLESCQKIAAEIASCIRGYHEHGRLNFIHSFAVVTGSRVVIDVEFCRLTYEDDRGADVPLCSPPAMVVSVAKKNDHERVGGVLRGSATCAEELAGNMQEEERGDTMNHDAGLAQVDHDLPPSTSTNLAILVREITDRETINDAVCGYSAAS